MACQSMLMVLVGFTPQYHVEQQEAVPSDQLALSQHVVFAEDVDSIVTEVRKNHTSTNTKTLFLWSTLCDSFSAVAAGPAAGLQGGPGWLALLRWPPCGECGFRTAVRPDWEEACLPDWLVVGDCGEEKYWQHNDHSNRPPASETYHITIATQGRQINAEAKLNDATFCYLNLYAKLYTKRIEILQQHNSGIRVTLFYMQFFQH